MNRFSAMPIDQMEGIHGGAVKLAGAELGVRSFGLQVLDFPAGFAHYPEHDHSEDGQEEVYLVLRGSAEFEVDGEKVPVAGGEMLRVEPGYRRRLDPGPDGVRILAIGCALGGSYERPRDFRLAEQR
ncbi:MAG: cupin domain-containing protein [Proteobacteria bacterium]|nr:cupin domain-containing protein [Pseudomonadota bacterium]